MRPEAELDIECFVNWFLVGITDSSTGVRWDYQMTTGTALDVGAITALAKHYTLITFNGDNYDKQMLCLAMAGADCAMLKAANDEIIVSKMRPWVFYKKYGCYPPDWLDHIDLAEPTPGVKVSLKQYACRMHSPLVQDSPVDFKLPLPLDHAPAEIAYCRNDRDITRQLRNVIADRIDLRYRMSERYGVDLRSKSDAQMSEAMVKVEWGRRMRASIDNAGPWHHGIDYNVNWRGEIQPIIPKREHGSTFKAQLPQYVHFATPYMQEFLSVVRGCDFTNSDKEQAEDLGLESTDGKKIRTGVVIPPELKGRDIHIGQTVYRVGIGGLHSKEQSVTHRSIPGRYILRTADVASYYPSLIKNAKMNPAQLGPLFLAIYGDTYSERLEAKSKLKNFPVTSNEYAVLKAIESGFKIVLNGAFGKLFSRFSIFFAPEFGIAVTIGGQLSLLMLIERLEMSGVRVVSANTDGIEMLIPFGYEAIVDNIVKWWEATTGLVMEQSNYLALHSRDVNSYVSIGFDGKVKRKGVFARSGVISPDSPQGKHPDIDICADAAVDYLTKGTPIAQTVMGCRDIRKFIRVRGAKGGARLASGGDNLGRAVRWYYGAGCNDYIIDAVSGNMVAGTQGARLAMRLPVDMPLDVDYPYYISTAAKLLTDVGITT